MKSYLQKLLRRAGVYERAKASLIYDFYWTLADPQIIENRRSEMRFYRELLSGFRKGDLIFDVGANQGYKTDIFLRLGAKVIALDPDETNQQTLRTKFLKWRFRKKPLLVVGKAVSDSIALLTMFIDTPGSAKNTLSEKWVGTLRDDDTRFGDKLSFKSTRQVESTTLHQLVSEYGQPFFVKIDVEGHELSVLRGLREPVPYMSFEVNLPEFKQEGLECVRVLSALAPKSMFNYATDCTSGLLLKDWKTGDQFPNIFESCTVPSIEVFVKTPS